MKGSRSITQALPHVSALYAETCRQRGEMYPRMANEMLARAAQWERDAAQVERDGKIVVETRELLASLETSGVR